MLTDFNNFSTAALSDEQQKKNGIKSHIKSVAVLLCEIWMFNCATNYNMLFNANVMQNR